MRLNICWKIAALSFAALLFAAVPAANADVRATDAPVDLSAETLIHNNNTQQLFAEGNVELVQNGRILRADRVVYDLHHDRAYAMGNVALLDENGDVYFAEEMELSGNLRDGFVKGLRAMLTDGSNFRAETAEREFGVRIAMENAAYTPCNVCEDDPDQKPLWQIRADSVVYDEEKQDVSYRNARLEVLGVPVLFTPIFSHPDPRKKQKTGFLRPRGGWTSDLGLYVKGAYYWALDTHKDATLAIQPTTRNGVLTEAEYRQHFGNGYIGLGGSFAVDSDRTSETGITKSGKQRGHIFADGRFDHSRTWRSGFNLMRTTDKGYLRLYDISKENILESRVFAERFANRDYTRIEAASFQDIRLGDRLRQPELLPLFEHRAFGAPGGLLGGRWTFGLGSAGLHRRGGNQDMLRASADAGWQRQFIGGGLKTVIDASLSGNAYHVRNSTAPGQDTGSAYRLFPYLHGKTSYPLVKPLARASWIVEPLASVTLAPRISDKAILPNEDSIDVQLDSSNLFDPVRFPGIDRVEDRGHAAYGIKTGLYGHSGWRGEVFAGQSVSFQHDPGSFPAGSGLENKYSDLVGAVNLSYGRYFDLNYKTQLGSRHIRPRRHEIQTAGRMGRDGALDYDLRYVFVSAVAGTGFTESREQFQLGAGYRLSENWRTDMTTLADLGADAGFRRGALGLHYADECFSFSLIGQKNLIDRASGENETSILLRIGLRHLGEFSMPQIMLDARPERTQPE
ncbi:MAG: LPS-assembly protein LptD [Micavibrio sp.]|nr:MAG: LPS-assembly protein LptD [Micavibrio sp.]